ncbi:MAG: translation initiation factor IF-2 [Deltaproteobacteria bacterium]|nr:translation initiation factor IF-2 [Deltaproteobacteria bacterium]
MAKIRVFELARELNITTRELLGKMGELEIEVKSHMSSLEDDVISRIKESLFGKEKKNVEETRVRPTVIRRRRKAVVKKPAETKPQAETVEPDGVKEPTALVEDVAAVESAPEKTEPIPVTEATAAQEATPEGTESAAAVEGQPAEPTAEEPTEIAADSTVQAQKPTSEETAAQDIVSQEVPETVVDLKDKKPSESIAETPAEQKVDAETPKAKKAKKKGKREAAAKIIQLPVEPVTPEPTEQKETKTGAAKRRSGYATARKGGVRTMPEPAQMPAKEKKKGKRAKKAEEPGQDKRFFKKKISFRRREVVEGAALFTGEKRGQKGRKKGRAKQAPAEKTQITVAKAIKRRIKIDDTIVLSELAKRMGIKAGDMIKTLMGMGVMATVNQTIDFDTAVLVAGEFDYEVERASFEEGTIIKEQIDDPEKLLPRPPVVTIMGHVDHGKTSLLDVIRKTRITEREAGGITQHIGAYYVKTSKGHIVFLDTPGHEAFTAMRARGAKVTDLVVLVVAADDGVMPQTVEAINHAKASEVPIIVAVNKIDKADAEPDRVQRQLAEIGLTPEDWGGETIYVNVSAKQNQGIDDLLDMILLQAEMFELKADPNRLAVGHVVEAKLDAGRGPVATVLIQKGTLRSGDVVVCGVHYGKVRALLNDRGQQLADAGPSIPVEVIGLSGVPVAGDEIIALEDEKSAKQISEHRIQKQRSLELAKNSRMSLDKLFEKMQEGEVKDLNLIIKADVDGSTEALRDSLVKLSNEEVQINVRHAATGTITESDVSLAAVSDAIIIGFNVRPNPKVSEMAQEENVDMRFYTVIYDVIKEVKAAILGMMAPTFEERVLGRAEVREVFHVPKVGAIAGCYVTDGKIERGKNIRVLRDGVIQYEGQVASLRRFKDDAKEVQSGYECGIGVSNYNDIKVGDALECFYLEEIKPVLE